MRLKSKLRRDLRIIDCAFRPSAPSAGRTPKEMSGSTGCNTFRATLIEGAEKASPSTTLRGQPTTTRTRSLKHIHLSGAAHSELQLSFTSAVPIGKARPSCDASNHARVHRLDVRRGFG